MALVRSAPPPFVSALEAAGIPFGTSRRGGLLHALEAQDLIPDRDPVAAARDLSAAHAKRPPFGRSDGDLLRVFAPARRHPRGWERLLALAGGGLPPRWRVPPACSRWRTSAPYRCTTR
jgi:ATP-dependent helicase/nuclease subunit A